VRGFQQKLYNIFDVLESYIETSNPETYCGV